MITNKKIKSITEVKEGLDKGDTITSEQLEKLEKEKRLKE